MTFSSIPATARRVLMVTGGVFLLIAGLVTASCGAMEMRRNKVQDSGDASRRQHRTGLPGAQRLEDEQETAEPRAEAPSRRKHKRLPRAAPDEDIEVALSERTSNDAPVGEKEWPPVPSKHLGRVEMGME